MNFYIPPEASPVKKQLNWFFFVLAALSAVPTGFFGLALFTSAGSNFVGFLFLWSAMWTAVWWSLRYR